MECAGFLTGMGTEVTVMVRSILLRGFDQEISEMIGNYMATHGTNFIRPAVPLRIEKLENNKLLVTYQLNNNEKEEFSQVFDTILFATGRKADTSQLGLSDASIVTDHNGKIIVAANEQTNVPHIYAIGDVAAGRIELTPSAIKAGKLLAQRLYATSSLLMNYKMIATTVFTPLEYGSCGYSEEDAIREFGDENIESFLSFFKPTSWNVSQRENNICYLKLICLKNSMPQPMRVIGFHVLGEHAGEITQGVAVAMKAGATKDHFDETIGIHPTSAETMTTLDITRSSGLSPLQKGC